MVPKKKVQKIVQYSKVLMVQSMFYPMLFLTGEKHVIQLYTYFNDLLFK